MSGEVRLSEALTPLRRYFESHALTAKALGKNDRDWLDALILLDQADARLAAVPVPSGTGLAAAVEALADEWETVQFMDPATTASARDAAVRLRALLSERTATTGGGGS